MTATEIGFLVKIYRDAMKWSQETLAELSGRTVRTIQRVEAGHPTNLDTRRAIARGFQIPDLDFFPNRTRFRPPMKWIGKRLRFDRQYVVLDANVVDGRKIMAMLIDWHGSGAISTASSSELPGQHKMH